MSTNRTERTKQSSNRTKNRDVYYENVILAYDDLLGDYINWTDWDWNNILTQRYNNTDWEWKTLISSNWNSQRNIASVEILLTYDDTEWNYINWLDWDWNNILIQRQSITNWNSRALPTTSRSARVPI